MRKNDSFLVARWPGLAVLAGLVALPLLAGACSEYNLDRPEYLDVFFQAPPAEVDVLLVVDNSLSMLAEQEELAEGFDEFVAYFEFADIDYHIGVITTDTDDPAHSGRLQGDPRWIEPDTPDRAGAFAGNVMVGTGGSGYERGLRATRLALSEELRGGHNAGFFREEAYLSILFVSDEDDYSLAPVADYINFYWTLKGERKRDSVTTSALVGVDDDGSPADCGDTTEEYGGAAAATRYVDVTRQTEGVVRSICSDDFGPIISEMGLNTSRLKDRFELSRAPTVDSIDVQITPHGSTQPIVVLPDDPFYPWAYEREEGADREHYWIVFTEAMPPVNCKIVVRYDPGSGEPASGDGDDDSAL